MTSSVVFATSGVLDITLWNSDATGAQVQELFSWNGTTYAFGDAVGTLAGKRVVDRSGAASTVCRAGVAAGYEVLIELKAGAGTISSSGFRVHYVSGGSRNHLDIKYRGVIMCQRDHVTPDCDQAAA